MGQRLSLMGPIPRHSLSTVLSGPKLTATVAMGRRTLKNSKRNLRKNFFLGKPSAT